jgi:hypothetical protein
MVQTADARAAEIRMTEVDAAGDRSELDAADMRRRAGRKERGRAESGEGRESEHGCARQHG